MKKSIIRASSANTMNFDEIIRRRKMLEIDIAQQELRIMKTIQRNFTLRNAIKSISTYAVNNALPQFSIINTVNNGWQWLKLAIRLIKRYI